MNIATGCGSCEAGGGGRAPLTCHVKPVVDTVCRDPVVLALASVAVTVAQLEVKRPGPYARAEALTVLKLMALAGSFTDYAAPNRTTLIRQEGNKRVERRVLRA